MVVILLEVVKEKVICDDETIVVSLYDGFSNLLFIEVVVVHILLY